MQEALKLAPYFDLDLILLNSSPLIFENRGPHNASNGRVRDVAFCFIILHKQPESNRGLLSILYLQRIPISEYFVERLFEICVTGEHAVLDRAGLQYQRLVDTFFKDTQTSLVILISFFQQKSEMGTKTKRIYTSCIEDKQTVVDTDRASRY